MFDLFCKKEFVAPKVSLICFGTSRGTRLKYSPKKDIKNVELAALFPLIVQASAAMSNRVYSADWEAYIKENKLERHFEEI